MELNKADKLKAQEQLSALVDYLIKSEDWKYIYLNEYAEPIRLFMFKTGLKFNKIKRYLGRALCKKLGSIYQETQHKLKKIANKRGVLNDELMPTDEKPRDPSKARKREHRASEHGTTDKTPSSEFGKKYREHFGYNRHCNVCQYQHEYRFYHKHGFCSWEVEGE